MTRSGSLAWIALSASAPLEATPTIWPAFVSASLTIPVTISSSSAMMILAICSRSRRPFDRGGTSADFRLPVAIRPALNSVFELARLVAELGFAEHRGGARKLVQVGRDGGDLFVREESAADHFVEGVEGFV